MAKKKETGVAVVAPNAPLAVQLTGMTEEKRGFVHNCGSV